ncbi:MAG: hypothetical protein RL318_2923 [Fibrobacterota bacterium]|jgi:hypothetical protein
MNWKNAGGADRIIRFVLGTSALAVALSPMLYGVAQVVAFAAGAILVATAVLGSCPLYLPFGIRTCKKD